MLKQENDTSEKARQYLIKSAGWTSQDLGIGRIIGEVMAMVYFNETPSSLDEISRQLRLSKAAVSIATRQLDKFGLLERVRTQGDRKTYYKTTEHLAATLQHGILELLRKKLRVTGEILDQAENYLKESEESEKKKFLQNQIKRARRIRKRADQIINNPLIKLISG